MSKDSSSKGGDKGIGGGGGGGGGDKDKDKGLNHEYIVKKLIRYAKLREVSSSPLPKKKMTKFFTKTVGGSSALQLGGGWPCVFHGYFLSTLSMIQPQMMELFCKITLEFLESVSISAKGRGRTSFMGAARTGGGGGVMPPMMSDISSVPPSDANSSPSSSTVLPISSSSSSSSSGSSPNSSASSATIVAASTSPPSSSSTSPLSFVGGCSGFGGFIDKENEVSLTSNPSSYSTAASRLAADAEVLLEYLKTHKVDLVNSLIGLTPTMSFLEKHCPEMLLVQQRYREQARNTEESEQKRKQRELTRLSRLSTRGGGLLSSSPTTSRLPPPSASASSLTSASASASPPSSSSPAFNETSSQKAAHSLSSPSIQEMTKHSLLKLIQDWAKIDDAFHLQQQLKLFAEQLDDYTCSTLQVGDLVITCSQDLEILFGRILECRAVEGAFIVGLTPNEKVTKRFYASDLAAFPEPMTPMLFTSSAAKRLVDSPAERFHREALEGVKSVVLNHLAKSDIDVQILDKVVERTVKISDESGMKRVVLQLETLPAPAMEKICSTLEDYFQGGLHELQQNATTAHPLLQDGMRSVAWFRVRHVVRKRLDEYLGRLKDALEFVKTERGLVLTGERKSKLANWWLEVIQDKVTKFLESQGYDFNAIPEDYIDRPPKSMWVVRRNLRIVQRWLHLENVDDLTTLQGLIESSTSEIYPILDIFVDNAQFMLSQWLQLNWRRKNNLQPRTLTKEDTFPSSFFPASLLDSGSDLSSLSSPPSTSSFSPGSPPAPPPPASCSFEAKEAWLLMADRILGESLLPPDVSSPSSPVLGSPIHVSLSPEPSFDTPVTLTRLKGLVQDCKYVLEMKAMEIEAGSALSQALMPESETAAPTKGKYVMSKVVPIAGLIIGCFARFENELNTVVELFGAKRGKVARLFGEELGEGVAPKPSLSRSISQKLSQTLGLESVMNVSPPWTSIKPTAVTALEADQGRRIAIEKIRTGDWSDRELQEIIERQLIEINELIDEQSKLTCLHLVFKIDRRGKRANPVTIVQFLLKKGANVRASDLNGWTPLHWACAKCSVDACVLLLDNGASATARNIDEVTPLHYLFKSDRSIPLMHETTSSSSSPTSPTSPTSSTSTPSDEISTSSPLSPSALEAREKYLNLILRMLEQVDIEHRTKIKETFVHYVCLSPVPKPFLIELLVKRGCPLNPNNRGLTPLHLAVKMGSLHHVKALLDFGTQALAAEGPTSFHALLEIATGKQDIVNLLIETQQRWSLMPQATKPKIWKTVKPHNAKIRRAQLQSTRSPFIQYSSPAAGEESDLATSPCSSPSCSCSCSSASSSSSGFCSCALSPSSLDLDSFVDSESPLSLTLDDFSPISPSSFSLSSLVTSLPCSLGSPPAAASTSSTSLPIKTTSPSASSPRKPNRRRSKERNGK